jgi:MoxR-like ATPase
MITEQRIRELQEKFHELIAEIRSVIIGHEEVIKYVLIGLLCGQHLLLEGVPGLGKTLLVRTLGRALGLKFARIQFTPDLMPADIIGTRILTEDEAGRRRFEFVRGPIFAHLVLADEINRATPKTQSALLEAMQERSITVSGETYTLEEPFMVLATQNPIEMEGRTRYRKPRSIDSSSRSSCAIRRWASWSRSCSATEVATSFVPSDKSSLARSCSKRSSLWRNGP